MPQREFVAFPEPLQQTIRAFQESRVILTSLELDVFTAIGNGATAAEVARGIGGEPRATETLLNALVACGLLEKRDGLFTNTPVSATYFAAGGTHDSRAAWMHTAHLWTTWSQLTEAVRRGTAVQVRDEDTGRAQRGAPHENWTQAFIAAMHRNASERAPVVVDAVRAHSARRMLDIGGGSGAYSIAFAEANPLLHVDLLDVPDVIPIAQRHIQEANLQDRIHLRIGDLRTAIFGKSEYDLILLSAICHMLSPGENRDLLARCFGAASPGGRVVIQDFIMDASKTSPKAGALFALNMLVGTAAGSTYSEDEYGAWLREAGFSTVQQVSLHAPTGLMVGTR